MVLIFKLYRQFLNDRQKVNWIEKNVNGTESTEKSLYPRKY